MDTKKSADPSTKECSNCGTSGAKLNCAKCKSAHYCSKACQKQHWKNGHKERCVAPDLRRPRAEKSDVAAEEEEDSPTCPICLETLPSVALCTLPCEHEFHQECVEALRKLGVLQACPLCRADLPNGPEKIFEEASRKFFPVVRRVMTGKTSWQTLTAFEKKIATEAKAMFTTAAKQGHVLSQQNLGCMFLNGEGVSQDGKEAARWFRKASDQGHADSQVHLSAMYRNGQGVLQNYKEALRWTRKAADQGVAIAQNDLAIHYGKGKGVLQNHKEAVWWYLKAAGQGHAEAQHNLGVKYITGEGVAQDDKEAARWMRKAADQGLASAQYNLGGMYGRGAGVIRDPQEAARWIRKGADQGDTNAQFSLGVAYQSGTGVPQDLVKAARWLRKAANKGHADAQHALAGEFGGAKKTAPGR